MAIVNGSLQIGKKDSTFFSANPTLILSDGQLIYNETTGDLFIGDGITALSSLVAINGASAGTWGSITGTLSNQTDLQNALNAKENTIGYTTENVANKSDSYTLSSSTTYASTKAVVDGLATKQNTIGYTAEDSSNKTSTVTGNETSTVKYPTIKGMYDWATGLFATIASLAGYVKKGTLTTNTIPKATASDTIGNSQITDDGTTVKINNKTEITDNDLTLYNTSYINAHLDTSDTYGGSLRIYDNLGNLVSNITGKDFATYFNTNYSFGIGTATPKSGTKFHVKTNTNQNLLVYEYAGKLTIQAENDAGSAYSSLQFYCDFELPLLTASQIVETDSNKKLISAAKGTAYNKNFGTGTTNVPEIGSTLGNTKPLITSSSGKLQTSDWTNIVSSCTFVGWSSYTTQEVDVIDMGTYYNLHIYVVGTSNSTTTTIQLPYTTLSTNNGCGLFTNNGTSLFGRWVFLSAGNTITFTTSAVGGTWTNSGTKGVGIDIFFKK